MSIPMAPSLSKKVEVEEDPYGYGDGAPDVAARGDDSDDRPQQQQQQQYVFDASRRPRRSSLKHNDGSGNGNSNNNEPPRWMQCRRASIGSMPHTATEREEDFFQIKLRGSDKVVRRRRSIEFHSELVNVKKVTPLREVVKSPTDLWMQPEDFRRIKDEVSETLKAFKEKQKAHGSSGGDANGENDAVVDDELRGLESRLNRADVQERRYKGWDAVIDEQDKQELTGEFDDEKIAQLYRFKTLRSPAKAVALAKQDREAVKDYLSSPKTQKMLRRSSC